MYVHSEHTKHVACRLAQSRGTKTDSGVLSRVLRVQKRVFLHTGQVSGSPFTSIGCGSFFSKRLIKGKLRIPVYFFFCLSSFVFLARVPSGRAFGFCHPELVEGPHAIKTPVRFWKPDGCLYFPEIRIHFPENTPKI